MALRRATLNEIRVGSLLQLMETDLYWDGHTHRRAGALALRCNGPRTDSECL